MEKRVWISFLLASCVTAGFSVKEEMFNDFTDPTNKLFSNVLGVFDDDGNLVQITFEDLMDIEELTDDNMNNHVVFYLHTRQSPTHPELIYVNDTKILEKSSFDPKKPTRFVTHGWKNSAKSSACTLVRDAYLKHGDYNVIVIDWSSISSKPYTWASNHVPKVAYYCSQMINFLQKNGMNLSTTIMAGHSLGAHVIGIAARNSNGKIGYIIGLDPAQPLFLLAGPGSRISSGDARYVEIFHTNAGFLGYLTAIGDADYYPNGGTKQPGCLADVFMGACSHVRSYKYFAESINSPVGFYGTKCDNFPKYILGACKGKKTCPMGGLQTTSKSDGIYYLITKSSSPYAIGQ